MKPVLSIMMTLPAAAMIATATTPSPRAGGYKGIWFTLGQRSAYGDKYSGGLGTYTANHAPMAVYSAKADKTYFVYGGTPAGDRRRLVAMISYYDHKTCRVPRPVMVMDKSPVDDPHDNPSLNIDSDGHLLVCVSGRARKRPGVMFRSVAPYSIDAFEKVGESEFTYPQIWTNDSGKSMFLFTKYTNGRELYWRTRTNDGDWSPDRKLAGFGGHYQTSFQQGDRIATFFNHHPGGDVDLRTNVYYAETRDSGETWTTADGRPLPTPLTAIDNPARVLDLAAQRRLMFTCDLNFDARGNPILLYVTTARAQPGPQGEPRELQVTRWTGDRWLTNTVTRVAHAYSMGSLSVGTGGWRIIAPTETGPQRYGAGGEIAIWTSCDNGQSWRRDRQVTSGSRFNHNYVRRPLHAKDPFFSFWADGNSDQPSESRLYFCDSSGTMIRQLPYDMPGDEAEPALVSAICPGGTRKAE